MNAAQMHALVRAQRGDWGPADELEIARIREDAAIKPRHSLYRGQDYEPAYKATAGRLVRCDAGLVVVWYGLDQDRERTFITDIDGVIVEGAELVNGKVIFSGR